MPDPTLIESDFIRAADLQALPLLQRPYELASVEEAAMRTGIEPSKATSEPLHGQCLLCQVHFQQSRDFKFAALGWSHLTGAPWCVSVEEIETRDRIV